MSKKDRQLMALLATEARTASTSKSGLTFQPDRLPSRLLATVTTEQIVMCPAAPDPRVITLPDVFACSARRCWQTKARLRSWLSSRLFFVLLQKTAKGYCAKPSAWSNTLSRCAIKRFTCSLPASGQAAESEATASHCARTDGTALRRSAAPLPEE